MDGRGGSTGGGREVFPDKSPQEIEAQRRARDVCIDITHAAELQSLIGHLVSMQTDLIGRVKQATFMQQGPFGFRVEIPNGAESYVSVDDEVSVESPTEFTATELDSVSRHGVSFYNRQTNERLSLRSFIFDIFPVAIERENDT